MPDDPTPTPTPPTPPAPTERTFTQTEMSAQMAREAEQARRQAEREIADRLGCTLEEAEQLLKDQRARDAEKLSEAEKRERAAAQAEAKAKADQEQAKADSAAAAKVLRASKIRDALLDANVKRDRLSFATDGIKLEDDADDKTIEAAVKSYKEQVPEWFDTTTPDPPKPGSPSPQSAPSPQPAPSGKPAEDAYAQGAERAKVWGSPVTQ